MISYATVSEMLRYAESPDQPWRPRLPVSSRVKIALARALKIPLPRLSTTRQWEYPWVWERLREMKPQSVLDCGCGGSMFTVKLAQSGYHVRGLDHFDTKDQPGYGIPFKHRQRYGSLVNFIDGDMANIPVSDNTFDAVTCISVMEHIVAHGQGDASVHRRCLSEMKRVLRPGGVLIVTNDTFIDASVPFGWSPLEDVSWFGMTAVKPQTIFALGDILNDEDAFFVPPDEYVQKGYGEGFRLRKPYHRMTSVGYALIK